MSTDMTDEELRLFADMVYRATRIRMDTSKKAMLTNRLLRRMNEVGVSSFGDYHRHLNKVGSKHQEFEQFVNAVTTNETYFFRAPKIWTYLKTVFLPGFVKSNAGKPLRIWCAASSSGEEVYSLAIVCHEFALRHPGFEWEIHASDISTAMLKKCAKATYAGRAIELVEPALLSRYFDRRPDGSVTVKDLLKKKVKIFRHQLQDQLTGGKRFELVLLRNVMIYFDNPTKEAVLAHVHAVSVPGSTLIVGEAEGLIGVKSKYRYLEPSIYLRED